ncbi:MAG: YceI family protein [Ornithinimicrobium sp.]
MTTTPDLPPSGTYEIDPARSTITFDTRHMFGLGGVTGTFTVHDGSITVPPATEAAAPLTVGVRVDAASFDTGTPRRDKHVKSKDFLEVEAHPLIEFAASATVGDFDGDAVTGSLRVIGNERPVTVAVQQFAATGDGVRVVGTTTINRYDFGVTKMKGMAGRDLEISIDLVAQRTE